MRSNNNAPQIDTAKREQKELRLRLFIESHIDADEAGAGTGSSQRACLLIARSLDSPVARVVADLVRQQRLKLPVRAILTTLDCLAATDGETASDAPIFAVALRLACDPRLLDAHEQLVLGPRTCWIGDCMRRDPLKRDAYEAFASDSRCKARRASQSFERLWRISTPVHIDPPGQTSLEVAPDASCVAAIAEEAASRLPGSRASASR